MTNETQQNKHVEKQQAPSFGTSLKFAREAQGLDMKDVAARLRLNEKIIDMLENDRHPQDIPMTFLRGYIRAYGKLVQLPETTINIALEPLQPKVEPLQPLPTVKQPMLVTSGNYYVQLFTYMIVFTMFGLVGMWWYSHTGTTPVALIDNQTVATLSNHSLTPPVTASIAEPVKEEAPVEVAPSINTQMVENTLSNPQVNIEIKKPELDKISIPMKEAEKPKVLSANATHTPIKSKQMTAEADDIDSDIDDLGDELE